MKIYRPQWRVQTFRKGGGVIQTRIEGEAGQKNFFSALRASVWSKIRRARAPWAPPLDPPQAPCKVIKDTLGFWIPRSKVDSGFQEYWIPNYLSVELGFRIFIVTVTDFWFPSGTEKRIPKPKIPGLHKQKWPDSFFSQRLPFLCSSLSFCFFVC